MTLKQLLFSILETWILCMTIQWLARDLHSVKIHLTVESNGMTLSHSALTFDVCILVMV